MMLSKNRNFLYLIQDIVGEESLECATRKRKAQSVSAITCWRMLSIFNEELDETSRRRKTLGKSTGSTQDPD